MKPSLPPPTQTPKTPINKGVLFLLCLFVAYRTYARKSKGASAVVWGEGRATPLPRAPALALATMHRGGVTAEMTSACLISIIAS